MSTEKVALPPKVRKLAAWAEQEIRGLDELCRGAVGGYDPMGSVEIGNLKELKAIAAGESGEIEDPKEFLKGVDEDVGAIYTSLIDHETKDAMDRLIALTRKLEKEISR